MKVKELIELLKEEERPKGGTRSEYRMFTEIVERDKRIADWLRTTLHSYTAQREQAVREEVKYEIIKLLAGNIPAYEKKRAKAYNEGVTSGWYAAREFIRQALTPNDTEKN